MNTNAAVRVEPDLNHQVAVVTGGGRGLGQAFATALAAAGASVAVIARSADQLEETVNLIKTAGGKAIAVALDVCDRPAVEQAIQHIETQLGPIDLLVNNAGILLPLGPLWELDPDEWWQTMAVNVRGALLCSRFVLPGMIARGRGRIINVASGAALEGRAYCAPYGVSKTALIRLSESLALEATPQGVSVFAICPGAVKTAMTAAAFSAAGQKWIPWSREIFDKGEDVPPETAAQLVLQLASGLYDALSGCYIQATDDLEAMWQRCREIQAKGLYTLRLPRLQPVPAAATAWITTTLQQAIQQQQANQYTQAEEGYLRVVAAQPNHPEALHRLGVLAQQRERLPEAERWWQTLLHYHPDSVKAWFSLGNLYQAQERLTDAETAYQRAIALQPGAAPIYNNLGYVLQLQGKFDAAIAEYQKALELQPDCVEAEANLGNVLHRQEKLTVEQQAHYAALNRQLGKKYQHAGALPVAIAYYQKAVELQPDHWDAYNGLGQIYQTQNDLAAAVAIYRQGLSLLNPHYAAAIAPDTVTETTAAAIAVPPISDAVVTVGAYPFPAIPPVTNPDEARPFWTVVIPVYNRTDYLLECLASVLLQWPGADQMEILVMDNASINPPLDLVNSLAGNTVRYYRHTQNVGGVSNYNAGISLARGHWVHVLHDDDCVLPGFYARLQQGLETCPDSVGVACTGFEYINEMGKSINLGEIVSIYQEQRGLMQNWLSKIGVCGLVTIPAMVIRRSAHEHLGGYFPELPEICDWEIFKRYASFYDWWYEPGILAQYREHTRKLTPENWRSGQMAKALRRAIEVSDTYLPPDQRSVITAKARRHNFNYCLNRVNIPLKAGNLSGALQVLQETLKIDPSPQAVAKVFSWLTQADAAPLRAELISMLTGEGMQICELSRVH